MPEGSQYKSHRLVRYEQGKPEKGEVFNLATNRSIVAFKLLGLEPGYIYELTWYYE